MRELDVSWSSGQRLRCKHLSGYPEKCGVECNVQVKRSGLDIRYELLKKLANSGVLLYRGEGRR